MYRTANCFITFTPKCFALAAAAVNVEVKARLLEKKSAKFYHFCDTLLILRMMAHSRWPLASAFQRYRGSPKI